MSVKEELDRRLALVPGLVGRQSRYGHGTAYFTGGREIAHFHGETRMDVRLTREVIRQLKSEGGLDQRIRTRGPSADWVEVHVERRGDITYALSLVEEAVRANA